MHRSGFLFLFREESAIGTIPVVVNSKSGCSARHVSGESGSGAARSEQGMTVKFSELSNESLLAYYESIRRQAAADVQLRREYRLVSDKTRQFASNLQDEMKLRELPFIPINWS